MNAYKVGLDIGSTTAKMVVLDKNETMVLFSGYKRHQAKIQECLLAFLHQIKKQLGDIPLSFHITGSVGMGISEKCARGCSGNKLCPPELSAYFYYD